MYRIVFCGFFFVVCFVCLLLLLVLCVFICLLTLNSFFLNVSQHFESCETSKFLVKSLHLSLCVSLVSRVKFCEQIKEPAKCPRVIETL